MTTTNMMTLRALLEKSFDADLLREVIGFTAARLMALEVEGLASAGHCECSPDRITHGNSYGDCPLEGDWSYPWLDATYVKMREDGRVASVAVTIAVAGNDQGRHEVLGMAIGASEAETF